MKIRFQYFLIFLFAAVFIFSNIYANNIIYISPVPGSAFNLPMTNIIAGFSEKLDITKSKQGDIKVIGSISGIHTGKIIFAEKDTRMVFIPDIPFEFNETVTVTLKEEKYSYSFFTSAQKVTAENYYPVLSFPKHITEMENGDNVFNTDTMPNITYVMNGPTASGSIFIANTLNAGGGYPSTLMILNNNVTPVFKRDLIRRAYDFDRQNENLITYFDEVKRKYYGLNRYYQIVDSFWCQNGYTTDFHELRVLPNGNSWLLSYDPQRVNMSLIVPGGNTNALVKGLVIQELNASKTVIFQWRSWDHFQITDATHENLLDDTIDYVHGNSIEIDDDNNIIISSRHMDEITKINVTTGDIIWRLGGKNNQFTFINDTIGFSHQHDARRIDNGHLTLYDNGNFHTPKFSRAIEYALSETNPKTATLVWQYRRTPSIYASATGNVQRLPNGNTLIGWGMSFVTLTEVNATGNILYELYLPVTMSSYRAFRYDWFPLVGVEPSGNTAPKEFNLMQNYPNPFNPSTNIKYQISKDNFVSLKIYDNLGKEIKTLVNEKQSSGSHEVTFSGEQFPSGIYYYKIKAGEFTDVKKMVLIK